MKNSIAKITVTEIGAKGDGIATHNGKRVFLPKTAPGDVAEVRFESENKDGYAARLLKLETPGPDRQGAPCPYYGQCGGCALQHVTPEFYRDWKIARVKEALERAHVAVEHWEKPVFLPHATRRRGTMAARKTSSGIRFGFNATRSSEIADVGTCMVLEPALDQKIQALRPYLPRLLPDNETVDIMLQHADGAFDMVLSGAYQRNGHFTLQQNETMAELAEKLDIARISFRPTDFAAPEILFTRKTPLKKFGAFSVALPPGAFLQASAVGEETLRAIVLKNAGGATSIADLFCGCGTFAGAMVKQGGSVYAADGNAPAIAALQTAAKGRGNFTAERRDLFKNPLSEAELLRFDVVILDPPRAGATAQAMALVKSSVPKIIYVSCNPASFARDVKTLVDGRYVLKSLTVVDQFVWSAHVELVGVFTR